jgi:hypothetical protein
MNEILDNIEEENPRISKTRHGCATTYLIFMMIVNSFVSLLYFINNYTVISDTKAITNILGLIGVSNVIFAVLLFGYKRIGFIGFLISSLISFGINISLGIPILKSLLGLCGIIVLYAVLQIKQEGNTAWEQLE